MRNLLAIVGILFCAPVQADWDFFGHSEPQLDSKPQVMAQVLDFIGPRLSENESTKAVQTVQVPVVLVQEYDIVCEGGVCRRILRQVLPPAPVFQEPLFADPLPQEPQSILSLVEPFYVQRSFVQRGRMFIQSRPLANRLRERPLLRRIFGRR